MGFYDINEGGFIGNYRPDLSRSGINSLSNTPLALPRNNLALYLDAANLNSYSGSGTTWTDISGNGKNGTLTNGTFNTHYGGQISVANNGYVNFGNNFNFTGTNNIFSVAMFMYWNINATQTNTGASYIFSKGTLNSVGYQLRLTSQGQLIFQTSQASASQTTATDGSLIRPNENNFIALVRNGATASIYVNGVQNNPLQQSHTDSTATTNNFYIGADASTTIFQRTRYSVFLIYERAISIDEIWTIFELYRGRYGI